MTEQPHTPAPPSGEEIHLPGPSLVPVLNAFGVAVMLVGLTTTWIFCIAGGLLFLVTLVRWIRDTVRDVGELPLEHH